MPRATASVAHGGRHGPIQLEDGDTPLLGTSSKFRLTQHRRRYSGPAGIGLFPHPSGTFFDPPEVMVDGMTINITRADFEGRDLEDPFDTSNFGTIDPGAVDLGNADTAVERLAKPTIAQRVVMPWQ